MLKTLFVLLQHALPHHALSRAMHRLARCENRLWKNAFIRAIVRLYGVNLAEAQQPDPEAYASFNAFFTRALKPEARPLCAEAGALLCPADGAISQIGDIRAGRMIQAKGKEFSAAELLGGDAERALPFANGKFATVYLSPRDYHRLHMPLAGTLKEMVLVPGRLFSVNAATADSVENLFARNERVVALFDTQAGPMALVLVGAIFVASIETVWHGEVTPPAGQDVRVWNYSGDVPVLEKGAEMGRFNMGSTIIVLLGENAVQWDEVLQAGSAVKMGQKLGRLG
ncbi:MAG: archaetidylserine decarboxylase [Candidatus Methylumidiphilus sp.]